MGESKEERRGGWNRETKWRGERREKDGGREGGRERYLVNSII